MIRIFCDEEEEDRGGGIGHSSKLIDLCCFVTNFRTFVKGLEICQRTKSYKRHVCPMMKNLTNESGGSPGTNFGKSGQTL